MKKIFITGDELALRLNSAMLHAPGTAKSPFAIPISVLEGRVKESAQMVLHTSETLFSDGKGNAMLSITGAITVGQKKTQFFSGIFRNGEGYEDCYLLVAEDPPIFDTNISRDEFISLSKKYCASRGIATREDGNIEEDGFPFFQSVAKDKHAPSGILKSYERSDIEICTMLHDDFFPVIYKREEDVAPRAYLGKYISDTKIRTYTPEEVLLLGMQTLVA